MNQKVTFFSRNAGLQIRGAGRVVEFHNGTLVTSDPVVIDLIKSRPYFGLTVLIQSSVDIDSIVNPDPQNEDSNLLDVPTEETPPAPVAPTGKVYQCAKCGLKFTDLKEYRTHTVTAHRVAK